MIHVNFFNIQLHMGVCFIPAMFFYTKMLQILSIFDEFSRVISWSDCHHTKRECLYTYYKVNNVINYALSLF